jgi:hypothetical protein
LFRYEAHNINMLIKNTLDTLNVAAGTDLIFEPGEIKDLSEKAVDFILANSEGFKIFIDKKVCKEPDVTNVTDFVCAVCGRKCKSKIGMISHLRTHK